MFLVALNNQNKVITSKVLVFKACSIDCIQNDRCIHKHVVDQLGAQRKGSA